MTNRKPITKAIIPVGGLGTRFYPATKSQPKEMLPVFDTPVIQLIVEEAVAAGITDIIFVTSPTKTAIRSHFSRDEELEELLLKRGKKEALAKVQHLAGLARFHYRVQNVPLGDGHALLQARDLIEEDEPVLVLFGDDIVAVEEGPNAAQQLLSVYAETGNSVVLLQQVPLSDSRQYGMVAIENETKKISAFVEKPAPADAPSDLGVVGKFILTPDLWHRMDSEPSGPAHEIRLADAFTGHIADGGDLRGHVLSGTRFDTGSHMGLLGATLYYSAKAHPTEVQKLVKQIMSSEVPSV